MKPEFAEEKSVVIAKYAGGALKRVSETGFEGYGIRWHNPDGKDLDGEWFSQKTYLMLKSGYPIVGIPANYQHGAHKDFGNLGIGVVTFTNEDEIGQFIRGEIKTRQAYIEMLQEIGRKVSIKFTDSQLAHRSELAVKSVHELIASVPMQFSGGFDHTTWLVDQHNGHIDQAGMIHIGFTPTPADNLNPLVQFKSAWAEVLKYEPSASYSIPNQQPDSTTGRKDVNGHKGDTDASTDIEPPPQANEATNDNETLAEGYKQMTLEEMLALLKRLEEAMTAFGAEAGASEEDAAAMADAVTGEMAKMDDAEELKSMSADALAAKAFELLQAKIEAQETAAKDVQSAFAAKATAWQKSQPATSKLPGHTGNGNSPHKGNIAVSDRYPEWEPEDYLFAAMLDQQIQAKGKRGIISEPIKFFREFANKVDKRGYTDKLAASGVKAYNAIKADELNHSTQSSYGDEWVPDSWDNNLWRKARLNTVVMPQFRAIDMPTSPYELPIEGADSTMYFVPETTAESQLNLDSANSPIPDSKIGSGKVQLSAKKFGARVGFSAELEEDSIIPILNIYREQAETAFNEGIDDVLLNADTETGTTNINQDGSALAATSRYLALNGLRKNTFTNSANQIDAEASAPTLSQIRTLRFLLSRQVNTKLPGLRIFTNPEAYSKLLGMDEFVTMDKAGALATAQTGQIGLIDNIPVFVSDQLPLVDADGKVSNGGNTFNRGSLLIAYAPHWYIGYRRRLAVDLSYIPYYDSYQLTLTARMDFVARDADSVALLYNIGI